MNVGNNYLDFCDRDDVRVGDIKHFVFEVEWGGDGVDRVL